MTSLDLFGVKDYNGLAKVCPNLDSLFDVAGNNSSCINEIIKCKDLRYVFFDSINQESFDTICNNMQDLTQLELTGANDLDISQISKLSKLRYLELTSLTGQINGIEIIEELVNLEEIGVNSKNVDIIKIPDTLRRIKRFRYGYECINKWVRRTIAGTCQG